MKKELIITHDYEIQSRRFAEQGKLVIPPPNFSEIHLPKLSELNLNEKISKRIKSDIYVLFYCARLTHDYVYRKRPMINIISENPMWRNTLASAIINYAEDTADYYNMIDGTSTDLMIHYIDANHVLKQEVPTDVVNSEGLVQKLVPMPYPIAQRFVYTRNLVTAKQNISKNPDRPFLTILTDLEKVLSGDGKSWDGEGRGILKEIEEISWYPNSTIIATLSPANELLYGNKNVAGLNKIFSHNITYERGDYHLIGL